MIYLVRHQAAGVLWQFPFAQPPSDDQVAVLANYCARLHGDIHPKTNEPHWVRVEQIETIGPVDEPPAFIPAGGSTRDNAASVGQLGVSGTGTVTKEV